MRQEQMISNLSIEDNKVLLNGKIMFTVPIERHYPNVVGYWAPEENNSSILIGSTACCHGHLYVILPNADDTYRIDEINSVDLNIEDMIPLAADHKKTGFGFETGFLVTGSGCSGSGVRLVDYRDPKVINILSSKEYHSKYPRDERAAPVFKADISTKKIYLELRQVVRRIKAGKTRTPGLPSFLFDGQNEESIIYSGLWARVDLTPKLREIGADIEKTFEKLLNFRSVKYKE